jgi:hypothetical protein
MKVEKRHPEHKCGGRLYRLRYCKYDGARAISVPIRAKYCDKCGEIVGD